MAAKTTTDQSSKDIRIAASEAIQVISEAANKATNTIADAAISASKLLASNAADAARAAGVISSTDHDAITTLITTVGHLNDRLTEKFDELKSDIKDIKDGTSGRIADHEKRIGELETSKTKQNTMMSIGIGILTLIVGLIIKHLLG